jgi:hypothetical protein
MIIQLVGGPYDGLEIDILLSSFIHRVKLPVDMNQMVESLNDDDIIYEGKMLEYKRTEGIVFEYNGIV